MLLKQEKPKMDDFEKKKKKTLVAKEKSFKDVNILRKYREK